jgi:ribose transport system substrate-binding protein
MSRKNIIVLVVLILLISPMVVVQAQSDSPVIGMSLPTLTTDYYLALVDGATEAAEAAGYEVNALGADYDVETEAANVRTLIDEGVAALLINPTDTVESVAAITAANEAGIPVFLVGGNLELEDTEVELAGMIGLDDAASGAFVADAVCTAIDGSGTVVELLNVAEDSESTLAAQAIARSEGFNSAMSDSCADAGVTSLNINGMSNSEVVSAISELLASGDVTGIVAYNDSDILLAMRATIRAGANSVRLFGFNASENALGAIQLGRVTGIVAADAPTLGRVSVETAVAVLSGEELEGPVYADALLVTADNLEDVRWCNPNSTVSCNQQTNTGP